jgi:hypothetical protein
MIKEPVFDWNEELGIASCTLSDGEREWYAEAICHDDDLDMKSEKTGCEIALRRARIKALQDQRRMLKAQLGALNQYYYSIKHSKKFNEKSYENKMLQRQINLIKTDLDTFSSMIVDEQQSLRTYLSKKDDFYKHIRKNREKDLK